MVLSRRNVGVALAWSVAAIVAASGAHGCEGRVGCLSGDDGTCTPAPACAKLVFPACADPRVGVEILGSAAARTPGPDALETTGDVVLTNDRLRLVLDALDAPHQLAPTGGNILDLVPTANGVAMAEDALNVMFTAVGILPRDAVAYRSRTIERASDRVSVIERGTLDGRPEMQVVTRYEVRGCEPGVRIRTELFHGGRDLETFFLGDAFYWGGREVAAFTPLAGRGFTYPELDLEKLGDAFAKEPFFAAHPARDVEAGYAEIPCDRREQDGFHSDTVSAIGAPRRVVQPGDGIAFERFLAVATGPGMSRAVDLALEARQSLWSEASVVVRGRVVAPDGAPITGGVRRAEILFYEPGKSPDAPAERRPWSAVVADADGSFRVRLPANRAFRTEVAVLGRPIPAHASFVTTTVEQDLGDVVVPRSGLLSVTVRDGAGAGVPGEVVLVPRADGASPGSLFGAFAIAKCTPWLGPPHGGSPACNRALLEEDGTASFAVPAGAYWLYATRGPFATISRAAVDIRDGEATTSALVVDAIDGIVPAGALSADFHVHGGASFDSSLPDRDRARTFVAAGIDVVAATDHDVVSNYATAIDTLGIRDRIVVLPGVETTGQILFYLPPGQGNVPRVVGHYNFWPLPFDPDVPRNGAPWDERLEPGALFDRVAALMPERGVIQMNHPFTVLSFGRDEGFLSAIGYDPRHVVPEHPDEDTPEAQLRQRPTGGRSALDYDTQEVMNGTETKQFAHYRVGWHSFLSQGILRAGTANSDSHTMATDLLGYPRNIVLGGHTVTGFDRPRFDADVRAGHMIGTNGPVILASVDGRWPGLDAFAPLPGAILSLEVRAAPWIPVSEVRVVVNGKVVKTITGLASPPDPFGKEGVVRYRGSLPLAELLAGVADDAWIVVEAGLPLVPSADLDDDGIPETTDVNGDGRIDDDDHRGLDEDDYWQEPARPREGDPRYHAWMIAPGHWTTAFTNPFVIDRSGDGWKAPRR